MPHTLWVICLCAEWCGVCREFRPAFTALARGQSSAADAAGLRFAWADVEDEAALVGDIDIDDFPNLLVMGDAGVLFQGPVAPHPQALQRLLAAVQADDARPVPHSAATLELLAALPLRRDLQPLEV